MELVPTCTQVGAELTEEAGMPVLLGELLLGNLQRTADLLQQHGITGDRPAVAPRD